MLHPIKNPSESPHSISMLQVYGMGKGKGKKSALKKTLTGWPAVAGGGKGEIVMAKLVPLVMISKISARKISCKRFRFINSSSKRKRRAMYYRVISIELSVPIACIHSSSM
jgi:hypothetical protein